jgi:hypothetical protein
VNWVSWFFPSVVLVIRLSPSGPIVSGPSGEGGVILVMLPPVSVKVVVWLFGSVRVCRLPSL